MLDDFEPPGEIVRQRRQDPARTEDADQSINLLYVAVTRATHRLDLAGHLFDELCPSA